MDCLQFIQHFNPIVVASGGALIIVSNLDKKLREFRSKFSSDSNPEYNPSFLRSTLIVLDSIRLCQIVLIISLSGLFTMSMALFGLYTLGFINDAWISYFSASVNILFIGTLLFYLAKIFDALHYQIHQKLSVFDN